MQELRMRKNNIKPDMTTYIYKNKAVYNGEWVGGFRHGFGRIEWSGSACYEGKWDCGYAQGDAGIFIDCQGNRYEGDFMMSMAHGIGSYINTQGAIYEGEWKFDRQHGKGTERWPSSNSTFEGIFADGLRNGEGEWL